MEKELRQEDNFTWHKTLKLITSLGQANKY